VFKWPKALAGSLVLMLASAALVNGATSPAVSAGSVRGLAEATRFREAFGLPSDPAYLAAVAADPTADSTSYGLPLLRTEVAELNRRAEVAAGSSALFEYVDAHRDLFGGALIDSRTGTIMVSIAGDNEPAERAILQRAAIGATVRFARVGFSLATLEARKSAITASIAELRRLGVDVTFVDANEATNQVEVGLASASPAAQALLRERFGTDLVITTAPSLVLTSCLADGSVCLNPFEGGMGITNSTFSAGCTAAYHARKSGDSFKYMMTAGHCVELGGGINVTWLAGPSSANGATFSIGPATAEWFGNNSSADAGVVKVTTTTDDNGSKNLLWTGSSDRSMTATATNASQPLGTTVCYFGRTTSYNCGRVIRTNYSVTGSTPSGPVTLVSQWVMDAPNQPGDSGGPVFFGSTYYGIMSARSENPLGTVYSTVANATALSGYSPCVTSSC